MEVKVTFNEDGSTEIEVDGVICPGCAKYTNALMKALSGELIEEKRKPEYDGKQPTKATTSG